MLLIQKDLCFFFFLKISLVRSFFLFLVYLGSMLAKLDCSSCLLLSPLSLPEPRYVNYFWVPYGPLHIPPLKQRSRQKLPNGKEGRDTDLPLVVVIVAMVTCS